MWSHLLVRAGLALGLALAALVPSATATLASCVAPAPLDQSLAQADVVFVGTVTGLDPTRRLATVQVEEIWRGPDLEPVVQVRGGQDLTAFTSVDRTYEVGIRYLFVPQLEGGSVMDNACTPTQPYGAEAAALRPASVRMPAGGAPEPVTVGPATLLIAGVVLAALAGVIVFGSLALVRIRATS